MLNLVLRFFFLFSILYTCPNNSVDILIVILRALEILFSNELSKHLFTKKMITFQKSDCTYRVISHN